MPTSQSAPPRVHTGSYEFGPFRLEIATGSLYRAGAFIPLTPKVAETLLLLVEAAGRVVTKETLMERVWPGVIVEEGSIANNISALRKILNPDFAGEGPIDTVARRGYRFTVDVRVRDTDAGVAPAPAPAPVAEPASLGGIRLEITERDTILIADIENRTGDPLFDGALKQALALHLAQSPFLEILSDRRVHSILGLMGRSPEPLVIGDVALEVCQRAGSKAAITGSIFALGDEYVIALYAVNGANGDILVSEQARASGKGEVLKALDKAALGLRSKLGESLASVQGFSLPLEEVATASLEALKSYAISRAAWMAQGDGAGVPPMMRAVEIDPGFASAYACLAMMYANLGQAGRAREFSEKAFALRDRVGARERYRIATAHHSMSSGDLHKAVQTCDAWHQSYPRDPIAALHLGSACTPLAQWEKALAATQQAVEIDHSAVGHSNLAIILLAMGRFADARATLENAFARNFDAYYLHLDAYQEAFLRGDTVSMEQHVAAVMGRPGEEDFLLATQADTEAYFGRLRQARELSRRAVDSARRADAAETAATWRVEGSLREAELGHGAVARDGALAALTLMPGRYVTCMAGAALARSGETARAQEIVASLDREYPQDTVMQFYWLPSIRAAIALDKRDWGFAVQILEVSVSIESGQTPPLEFGMLYPAYLRGQAYLAGRMGAEAAREFQKLIDRPGLLKNFILFPLAHLGAARAHALAGNRDKSRAEYDRFLELWKSADADLAIMGEAKAERARS